MNHTRESLLSLCAEAKYLISYDPLRSEVNAEALFEGLSLPNRITVPPRADIDPQSEARKVRDSIGGEHALIFIPGRRFDASGTRHGQGGGWYDRFLADVPREWLRIGFCYEDQLSATPLKRESWDQAMDYVVVVSRTNQVTAVYSSEGTSL